MQEKRGSERRDIHVPIVCWKLESGERTGKPIEAVCKDMSTSGVCFESARTFPVGTDLECEIRLPGRRPLVTCVTVTRIESLFGAERCQLGVTFVAIDPEDREAIAACLDRTNLYTIIHKARQCGASDVHLAVGRPPVVRVQGRLRPLPLEPLGDGEIKAMIYPLLEGVQIKRFEAEKELDFAFSPNLRTRYRVNLHYQRGFLEATLRSVPASNPSFEELGLDPGTMEKLCQTRAGLILVSGTTGAGKTTTMASMVDWINRNQERVVVTIESPIEFTHASLKSIIKQRELGTDTLSYSQALQRSLRQDPDVIVVGELIDADCVTAALRAAETGHLVVSTVHAPDSEQTLERMVNLFPPEHATAVCRQLASCLEAVLYQTLITGKDGRRVLASELLVASYAVRHLIREQRFNRVPNCIQTGRDAGMYTLQSKLEELRRRGLIEDAAVRQYAKRDE